MGDITQERDDNLYTSAANIIRTIKVQGDTNNRFQQNADGDMSWGSGSATPDVVLERIGTGILGLSSGTFQAPKAIVNCTASTLTVTAALHSNAIVTLNRAAGIAVTLPAATGSGNVYTFIVGTTFTGAASIAVADATDYMIGTASLGIDGGTAVPHQYPTANTGTLATESDTLSLFGTANSQGGIKGQIVELIDIATDVWFIRTTGDAGGTEATPFSAAV